MRQNWFTTALTAVLAGGVGALGFGVAGAQDGTSSTDGVTINIEQPSSAAGGVVGGTPAGGGGAGGAGAPAGGGGAGGGAVAASANTNTLANAVELQNENVNVNEQSQAQAQSQSLSTDLGIP